MNLSPIQIMFHDMTQPINVLLQMEIHFSIIWGWDHGGKYQNRPWG